MKEQTCTQCKTSKPISEFYKYKDRDKYFTKCKDCKRSNQNDYYEKNTEKCKETQRKQIIDFDKNKQWQLNYINSYVKIHRLKELDKYHSLRVDPDNPELLQIQCVYCGKWYNPTNAEFNNRLTAIKGTLPGEHLIYCSEECKTLCPVYNTSMHRKGNQLDTSREAQPDLRKLTFLRDNYTCQKCNNTTFLQCHHIEGIYQNPIESADIDNCITLCKDCHKNAHSAIGCRFIDLRRCKESRMMI